MDLSGKKVAPNNGQSQQASGPHYQHPAGDKEYVVPITDTLFDCMRNFVRVFGT